MLAAALDDLDAAEPPASSGQFQLGYCHIQWRVLPRTSYIIHSPVPNENAGPIA